jgi:hypothetical protein
MPINDCPHFGFILQAYLTLCTYHLPSKQNKMPSTQQVFALTICAYKKEGMDEDEYHQYMTDRHAASVKDLMVKNKIISYTMVKATIK